MVNATSKLNKVLDTIATAGTVVQDEVIGGVRNMIIQVSDRHFSVIQQDENSYGICLCFPEKSGNWVFGYNQKIGKTTTVAARFIDRYAA